MIRLTGVKCRISIMTVTGTLVLGLQSCGSSGSGGSGADEIFADPVDATTLQDALITGMAPGDEDEFWRCTLGGSGQVIAYRLFADGSGSQQDLPDQGVLLEFTWQSTSESTMTTVLSLNGLQSNLRDIQFTDRDTMSLVLEADGTSVTCNRQGSQLSEPVEQTEPTSNSLSYGGVVYQLTHGFEEVFEFRPQQSGDTHLTAEFEVADAPFVQTIIDGTLVNTVLWRPNDATVWLRADLHSPGGDGFESATFTYEPDSTDEQGPLVDGVFFFNEGRFGVDTNQDGSIETESNEFFDVVGGTISVDRMGNFNARMSFDITLEDGVDVTGSFTGSFPVFEH